MFLSMMQSGGKKELFYSYLDKMVDGYVLRREGRRDMVEQLVKVGARVDAVGQETWRKEQKKSFTYSMSKKS